MHTALIYHHACLKHDMGRGHPEQPERLRVIQDQLISTRLYDLLQHHDAPLVTRQQLERVHSKAYVDFIERSAPVEGMALLDADTSMNPFSLEAARRAAGAVVLATDLVLGGKAQNAFCNVRPPGHHACHDRAMGFCIFNNVAVGVAHALRQHGLQRVAIADFDVHHGNGTEDIFRSNPQVMLCSTFQHPFYPHCGAGSSSAHIINVPLPAGTKGEGFRTAIQEKWLPALEGFKPEMIFVSAGFDAHAEDEMAGLRLIESDYQWVTEQIMNVAQRFAQGRIVSVLEGGYALSALARSAVAHIRALCS